MMNQLFIIEVWDILVLWLDPTRKNIKRQRTRKIFGRCQILPNPIPISFPATPVALNNWPQQFFNSSWIDICLLTNNDITHRADRREKLTSSLDMTQPFVKVPELLDNLNVSAHISGHRTGDRTLVYTS